MNKEKFFEGVAEYKLLAKKEVGQNFLIDYDAAERIVLAAEIKESDSVLEIGCGAGSLTYFLSLGPAHSRCIDIDESLLTKVKNDFKDNEYLEIENANAMRFDYSGYTKIVGNLPYYITSGIVENALSGGVNCEKMVFMLQKEAVERLLAKPGTEDYSPLSLYMNYVSKARRAFNVNRNCFAPTPHVDSSVLVLDIIKERHNEEAVGMYKLASKLFLQRRKTIYNNLRSYLGDADKAKKVLEACSIRENLRPEQLLAEDYLRLFKEVSK